MHDDNVLKHICTGVFAPEQLAWSVVKNNASWLTRLISEWMTEFVSQTCSSRKKNNKKGGSNQSTGENCDMHMKHSCFQQQWDWVMFICGGQYKGKSIAPVPPTFHQDPNSAQSSA